MTPELGVLITREQKLLPEEVPTAKHRFSRLPGSKEHIATSTSG